MHAELFLDCVRRSREEERKLRKRAADLLELQQAMNDPNFSAIFISEVEERERRADEYRSLAEQCERFLAEGRVAT